MRLMELMTTDVQTATPDEEAERAYQRMRVGRFRHLVVMEGPRVLGVVTERDLGGARGSGMRRGRTVGEFMSRGPVSATPTTTVRRAANLLRAHSIGCLPVLEGGKVVGVVTLTDLLELLGRKSPLSPRASSRYQPQHGSRWKPVRRMARPHRPELFPR